MNRHFSGNFSCIGLNPAGASAMFPPLPLEVYYPPGKAQVISSPGTIYKGGSLFLHCSLDDPGRPAATHFMWGKGGDNLAGQTSQNWTINPVTTKVPSQPCTLRRVPGASRRCSPYLSGGMLSAVPDWMVQEWIVYQEQE